MEKITTILSKINSYIAQQDLIGELSYHQETSHLVRAGRGQVSLNTAVQSNHLDISLYEGQKQMSFSTTLDLSNPELEKRLMELVDQNKKRLKWMPEKPHMKPLRPLKVGEPHQKLETQDQEEIDSSIMVNLFSKAQEKFPIEKIEVSGSFSAGQYGYAFTNTLSDFVISMKGSDYNGEVVLDVKNGKKEIKAAFVGERLSNFEFAPVVEQLQTEYQRKSSIPKKSITPKKYDVVFGPEALAEMTVYLTWVAFNGIAYEMEQSMLLKGKHHLNDKLFGENISLIDDPENEHTLFNRKVGKNGVERFNFPLIEKGVIKNFIYSDKDMCDRYNKEINNDFGVLSLQLETGDGPATFNEMVENITTPTLYIGTLHYMNFTNPTKGEFTGTSRFGTYLIENGKVQSHLNNVRVNDSFWHIFNNVQWLSREKEHVNLSNSYGQRSPFALTGPKYIRVADVPITASFDN
jgi:predicted Zn-dependent protease